VLNLNQPTFHLGMRLSFNLEKSMKTVNVY